MHIGNASDAADFADDASLPLAEDGLPEARPDAIIIIAIIISVSVQYTSLLVFSISIQYTIIMIAIV